MKYVLALVLLSAIAAQAYTPVEPSFASFLRPKLSAAKHALQKLASKIKGLPEKAANAGTVAVNTAVSGVNRGIEAASVAAQKVASKNPKLQEQIKQVAEQAKQAASNVGVSAQKALASGQGKADQVVANANEQLKGILEKTENKLAQIYDWILNLGEPTFD